MGLGLGLELESQQVTPRNSHPYPDPGRSPLSLTPNPNSQLDSGLGEELKRRQSSTDTLSAMASARHVPSSLSRRSSVDSQVGLGLGRRVRVRVVGLGLRRGVRVTAWG